MKIEITNNNKTKFYIHIPCIEYNSSKNSKKDLISRILKEIKDSPSGFAGFNSKSNLKNYLNDSIFDKSNKDKFKIYFSINVEKIVKILKTSINKCVDILPVKTSNIFIFPTFSQFIKKDMHGTTGYTPWNNTILIFIYEGDLRYNKSLSKTLGHEYNHMAFLKNNKCDTILDSIIFEGLAENFREQIIGGSQSPWSNALNIKQAEKILYELKLEKLLLSSDQKIRRGIFFGNEKYVRWTGYSIGYHIVKSFIKKNKNLSWKDIMTKDGIDFLCKSTA